MDAQQTVSLAKALANAENQTRLSVDSGTLDQAAVNQEEQYNRKGFGARGSSNSGAHGSKYSRR
jgi:hypothetical protein